MPVERSAGAVIFHRSKKGKEYLLLKHSREEPKPKTYWSFPKGHIEKGETSQEAAIREIYEETELKDVTFVPGFKETERYFYVLKGKKILKFVVWFLARSKKRRVKISWEHTGAVWLPYAEARRRLTYPNAKEILRSADRFLRKNGVE